MKPAIVIVVILILVIAAPIAAAAAEKQSGPKYDLANEVKLSGSVEEVKVMGDHEPKETHIVIKSDKGLVELCLCPAKFLTEMDIKFAKGDKLQVTGSKATEAVDGTEVILVREIVRGDDTLVFRDKNGGPVWTWLVK